MHFLWYICAEIQDGKNCIGYKIKINKYISIFHQTNVTIKWCGYRVVQD